MSPLIKVSRSFNTGEWMRNGKHNVCNYMQSTIVIPQLNGMLCNNADDDANDNCI